jgi:hypothetical protein
MEPNTCFPRGTENLLREPDGMELVQALLWKNETGAKLLGTLSVKKL